MTTSTDQMTSNTDKNIKTNIDEPKPNTSDQFRYKRERILSDFLHKRLRKHGLTKTCDEIRKILKDTLPHALQALQIDRCERVGGDSYFYYHLMPLHQKSREFMSNFPYDEETVSYGIRSEWFQKLDLPSFRPLYLYLCNVMLDLMHTCIEMQIENKKRMELNSNFKFSILSIEVLAIEVTNSMIFELKFV
jgi:hypothetical protein